MAHASPLGCDARVEYIRRILPSVIGQLPRDPSSLRSFLEKELGESIGEDLLRTLAACVVSGDGAAFAEILIKWAS